MSWDSGIKFVLTAEEYSIYDTLLGLLDYGWLFEDNGHISMLPLGDKGDFAWTYMELSQKATALEIIRSKIAAGEIVGVTLTWTGTNIGIDALFSHENTILVSLSINRKLLANSQFTDVSWYLEKILPALIANKLDIEHITWNEHP